MCPFQGASHAMTGQYSQQCSEAAAELQKDGYTVVRGCVDGHALGVLADQYESQFLADKHHCDVRREANGILGKDGLARVVHVSNIFEMPNLANIASDRRLLALASACLGGVGVRPIINCELFDKPPEGNMSTQTPPHQDNFYFKAEKPGVALWITLDEMDTNSGTVQFVRGSHLRGLRFHDWECGPTGGFSKTLADFTDEDDDLLQEVGSLSPGDVVVHHGLTIHYAPTNQSSKRRRGLVINYIAENVAYTLADDLHKVSLNFEISKTGHLIAALPKGWPDRQVLASVSVKCALAGWRGVAGGIQGSVRIEEESSKLIVEISDPLLQREAIIALVQSGHLVRGAGTVDTMPLQIGSVAVSSSKKQCSNGRLPEKFQGIWMLSREEGQAGSTIETKELALWLQTLSGAYIDFRLPRSLMKMRSVDFDKSSEPLSLAEQSCSAGSLSLQGEFQDVAVRHRSINFHPFNGMADVGRISWHGADERTLVEVAMSGHHRDCKDTWTRVDELVEPESVAVLELVDDKDGRCGLWVIVGTWFGRVVGRAADHILSNVVCRSLAHAMKTYEDECGIDHETAVHDFEASIGRVEAPGVFRIMHDLDPACEGECVLDNSARQLRRDAADDDVLIESFSKQRWKIRDMSSKFAAFGNLKRMIA
jgi:phytanoyl-CoA hydroxylase